MIKLNGRHVELGAFPNGETQFFNQNGEIKHKHTHVIDFKYEGDESLIHLMFVRKYLDTIGTRPVVNLTIRYMPYSRMDRSKNNSPFTLKDVADFINGLNFNKVTVIEPHSDVTLALLNNSSPLYINFDLIKKVKKDMAFSEESDVVVFPDAGASKRYAEMENKNVLFGHKKRDFETGLISKELDIIGNVPNKPFRALIVDDLSSYGGTFVGVSKKLREIGATEIHLLVAHAENSIFKGTFKDDQKDENEKEKTLFDYVDKIYTTDTILSEENSWGNSKFREQLKIYRLDTLITYIYV